MGHRILHAVLRGPSRFWSIPIFSMYFSTQLSGSFQPFLASGSPPLYAEDFHQTVSLVSFYLGRHLTFIASFIEYWYVCVSFWNLFSKLYEQHMTNWTPQNFFQSVHVLNLAGFNLFGAIYSREFYYQSRTLPISIPCILAHFSLYD